MSVASSIQWLLAVLLPLGGYLALLFRLRRARRKARWLLGTLALGAGLYLPALLGKRWVLQAAEIEVTTHDSLALLFYTFLVVAPLEQGLRVGAVLPVYKSDQFYSPFDGVMFPTAAAMGFATTQTAVYLWGAPPLGTELLRAMLAVPAGLAFAQLWGYALGRDKYKRLGGRFFNGAFVVAVLFHGIYDHIVFSRGPAALIAAVPLLVCVGLVAGFGARDLYRRGQTHKHSTSSRRTRRFLRAIQPPSLRAMREALRRTERPVMLTWIAFGALVTTGVITSALAGAVYLGHHLGVDFAAVDRSESAAAATPPLVLLGCAVLAAFPVAGFLVARASSTRTVLEPAMSAALAITGTLILLGFAAPVAVVFALACAPIAFALACAGAWVGLAR